MHLVVGAFNTQLVTLPLIEQYHRVNIIERYLDFNLQSDLRCSAFTNDIRSIFTLVS